MRKLASIQKIIKIEPIEGADKIEKATILGWEVVVKKDEFKAGDLVVYCEIDSILPDKPEFSFLKDRKFRIRTIKLRNQISQGICFPLSILPENVSIKEDKDVTEILGIVKYESPEEQIQESPYPKWMPSWLVYIIKRLNRLFHLKYYSNESSEFPEDVPKTDETRVQTLQGVLDKHKGKEAYGTEKVDGTSITIRFKNNKLSVYSRNRHLFFKTGKYWQAVKELQLEKKFKKYFNRKDDVVFQGELLGPGIQGNRYKFEDLRILFFDIFFPKYKEYASYYQFYNLCKNIGLDKVPLVYDCFPLPDSIPEIVEMSKGKSYYNSDIHREGIVIRLYDNINQRGKRVSLKAINPDYLLKYE